MIDMPREWLRAAADDIDAAQQLIIDDNLTNIASFHCQQAIEKSFKAILEKHYAKIEKTHNLEKLYDKVSKFYKIELDESLLLIVNEMYIESRYPIDLGLLPDGKPPVSQVEEFIDFARFILNRVETYLGS
jgi:HEPN domain-containing protein